MSSRRRAELSELVVHAGAGFVAKDRPYVRAALSTLRPHLGRRNTDDVTVEVSLQDRGRREQRVTLRITLPDMEPLVAVATNGDVMRALDEARRDVIRQLGHHPYALSRRRRTAPIS